MTPVDLDKELTLLLSELLADTGFSKKRIKRLQRNSEECEQFFSCRYADKLIYGGRIRSKMGYCIAASLYSCSKQFCILQVLYGRTFGAVCKKNIR